MHIWDAAGSGLIYFWIFSIGQARHVKLLLVVEFEVTHLKHRYIRVERHMSPWFRNSVSIRDKLIAVSQKGTPHSHVMGSPRGNHNVEAASHCQRLL